MLLQLLNVYEIYKFYDVSRSSEEFLYIKQTVSRHFTNTVNFFFGFVCNDTYYLYLSYYYYLLHSRD